MSVNQLPVSQVSGGVGMQNLADNTLGGSAASVTFSNISGLYKHLMNFCSGRGDRAASSDENLCLQFNADTGANYRYQYLDGTTTAASSAGATGATSAFSGNLIANNATAGFVGVGRSTVFDYASTTFHKGIECSGGDAVTDYQARFAMWQSTAAITSEKFFSGSSTNLVTGTRITLQGIQ